MQKLYKKYSAKGFKQGVKIFAVLFFTTFLSVRAVAQNYTPNTLTDPVIVSLNNATGAINGGATISLRSALMAADNLGGTHIVTLSTGTYNLTQAIPNRQITIGNTAQNITINGNGPTNTIINNTLDANKDRILFINPSGTTNSPVITVNGIRFQNGFLSSDPFGGAAICSGGGSGESLTVTNCTFDNNVLPAGAYGGAAINVQVRGNLTVDNCTFTNNVSNDADGGAILFIIFNSGLGTGFGTMSVTNSTFTSNSVVFPGAGTSNGGALAFTGQAGVTPFNATINNNTFITNTADGLGGAIVANNSPNLSIPQIHFNRFFNNTSAAGATSSGLHFVESSGSVNAENNWWGCNTNPVNGVSTAPCNQAGGDVAGGGSLDANPWMQLQTTPANNPICNTPAGLGNTNLITTSFVKNSDGTSLTLGNLSRVIGLPVTWGPTVLGSLSAQQVTIQAGTGNATALFTSNGTGGTATVNAQVDNVPAGETTTSRATFTVNTIPTVTNPTNFTSCVGGTATFSSTITGTPAPTIKWYKGGVQIVNGATGTGATYSGATTNTLTITGVQPGDAGNYNVDATNQCGTATSTTAALIVNSVTGGTVGSDQTICSGGDPALFTESVASTGSGALTYQWQSSTTSCAAGFSNIAGATSTTYDPPSGLAVTTFYRRVTTSTLNAVPCTANSNCITVTINNVTGGTVAADQTICSGGDPAAFTQSVASTGSGALTYQWQSSTTSCAAGFSDIGGATATTYDPLAGLLVTTFYRRVTTSTLTAVPCTANSNCITVTVNDVTGGTVAIDQTICSGGDPAAFTQSIASTGSGALTYQWQSSTTSCAAGFSNIGGATATTYDPPAGLLVTTFYRRVTTSTLTAVPCTANSNCITVTVNNVTGGTVAADQTICSGGDPALFTETVASTGSGALTYQWQSSITSCAAGFSDIGGATGTTYDAPSGLVVTTYYRRVTTSTLNAVACTANSNCITVTVNNVTGGTVGSDQGFCFSGDPALFTQSVASTGSGALTYQWQSSTTSCAAGFSDIGGATGTTYDAPAGLLVTTYYRRVTTSTLNAVACTANSNCITVTMNNVTGGTVGSDQSIPIGGDPAAFTEFVASTGSGALTYQWQSSTTSCAAGFSNIGGANSATYDAPAGLLVTTYYRRVTTSTLNGVPCTANSNCITVTASAATCFITLSSAPGTNNQTVCNNTSIINITYSNTASQGATGATFTALPTGVTGAWVGDVVTISGTPSVAGIFNYTVTLVGGACAGISTNGTINVNDVTGGTVAADQTVCSGGDPAAFTQSIASTGIGALTYQWQSSTTSCAAGFSDIGGATAITYDAPAGLLVTTYYRRVTTSTLNSVACTANSNCITVTVNNVTGGTVGSDQTICSGGDPAAFTESVASTGIGALTYQWQSSTTSCAAGFANIGGATSSTYDPPSGLAVTTYYRRVTTSTLNAVPCTANSNCITVTVNNVTGGTIAADQTICSGGDPALFTQSVASTGSGALTYQWQSSTTSCAAGFSDIAGATNTTYDAPSGLAITTFYRRVTTSTLNAVLCIANSNCITVTVNSVTGGTVGSDQTIPSGGDPAAFTETVASTGGGTLTYQWQSSTTSCVAGFSNIAGATGTTYDPPAGLLATTYYRRITTSTLNAVPCATNSNCITVTVSNVTGGTVAADQTICSGGDPAAFTETVPSTGGGTLTYQWQSSTTDCTTGFSNIAGATSTTYDAPAGLLVTTYYRRVTTSSVGPSSANSNCITLTVNPIPDAVATPSAQTVCSGTAITTIALTGSVPGTVYNWIRDNTVAVTGIAGSGSGNIIGTLTNATAAPVTVTFTITPAYTNAGVTCTGTPITATVLVNPSPAAFTIGGGGVTVCPTGTTLSGPIDQNYTYQWGRSLFIAPFTNMGTAQTQAVTASSLYQLVVTNQFGCSTSNTTVVNVADYVFNGSLGVGDPQQTGRIDRFAVVSTCAAPKACPGIFTAVGARFYDSYTITNIRNVPVCATIGVNSGCGTNIFSVAYLTSFNPASTCTNYLADPGSSPTNSIFYEVTIPALSTIEVVVHEVNVGAGCGSYELTVDVPRDPAAITVSPAAVSCSGAPITLTAPAANTYSWNPGGATTQSILYSGPGTTNYTVTLGYGNNGCTDSRSQSVTIVNPTVNPVADQAACNGSNVSVTFSGSDPLATYNWTNTNPAIGLPASGSGNLNFTATNGTNAAISGTITVTPVNGVCSGPPIIFTITVASQPVINTVTGAVICEPGGIVNLSATGNGTINWWNALTGGVVINTGTTFNPNVTTTTTYYVDATTTTGPQNLLAMPAQSNIFPGNVRGYWFTAPTDFVITSLSVPTTASSGPMSIAVMKFTGNIPPPVFAAITNAFTTVFQTGNNPSLGSVPCNIPVAAGEVIGILGYRGNINSYAPGDYNTTIAGFPVQLQRLGMQFPLSTSPPHDIWREFGAGTSISRVEFEYSAGQNCVSAPRVPVTATVNPLPVATATPSSQTICSGSAITTIVLTSTVPGTVFNWTRDNTVPVTGIAASGSGNNISGSLTNTTNAPVTVTFTITPSYTNAGVTCTGTPVTATVVVNPIPNAVATPSAAQIICSGSAITTIVLTGNVAGTVYNWTRDNTVSVTGIAASGAGNISGSLTNTTNAPVTVTFTITPSYTNAGVTCTGTPITVTVVVNPIPNAVATPAAQTICSGSAITTINLTGSVAGTVFSWTRDNNATVTGIASSGSGAAFISGSLTNHTNAAVTVTFTITPSFTNAGVTCTGPSITATVVVNPIPNAVATPAAQTICSGSAITTIVLTGNVVGTVYNWTRDNTGSVTGIAASGAGNISGSLTNTTNAPVTVTFTITPSYTNAGVTCTGTPITATVVVNPIPNAVATPAAQTICSGSGITTIVLTGNVINTIFNWTRNNTGTVTGIGASGTGDIGGSLVNTTNAPVTVTFTITPSYTNGGVTCTGTPITATVIVNPIPDAVATPSAQTICSGSAITTIALTGNVVGTVYNWVRDNTGTVTGIAASGTGNISGSLTNTTTSPITVTFTITPSYTNAGVTCTGASITATVVVNPIPDAVATPTAQTICSGSSITTISIAGNVIGTVFNWTRDNTATATGIAASGSGNISGVLTNTTNAPVTVTFTITPSYTNAGVTCTGTPITVTVVVNPIPNAVATPASQTSCSGATITTIALTGNVTGTVFNWTRNNTASVTGIAASGSGNISGALTNTTNAPVTVTFTITPSYTNAGVTCAGTPVTATVLVNPTPDAVATPPSQTVCSDNLIIPIILSGNVAGTTFNWTRNNTVTVTGIAASGSGNISGTLTNTTNAPILVTFTITPTANGCPGTPITATVLSYPTPNAVATPPSQTICSGSAITTIVLSGGVAGTTFNWTRNNTATVTGIAASGSGNISGSLTNTTNAQITVTFTITPTANGCPGPTSTATVVVNPTPTITCPANIVVNAAAGTCSAVVNYPPATATGTPAPTITYSIASGSSFPVGVTTVTVTASNICGTVTCTFTITVNDVRVPLISTQPVNAAVCVGNSATFSVVATNVVSYQWQLLNGNSFVNIAGATAASFTVNNTTLSMNNNIYRVALTGPCGTVVFSNQVTLTVNPLPIITLSSSGDAVLLPNRSITITASANPPGGSFVWLFNGTPMPGVTGSSLGPLTVLNVGTYSVIYTDPNGCVSTSLPFIVSAGVTSYLWVYPNPNTGQFNVRFYNITGETATLKIFNGLGQLVYTQSLVLGVAYSNFLIDMRRHAAGVYTVKIMNGSGAELAAKRLMIYHP